MSSILCKYYVQNDPSDPETMQQNLFVMSKKPSTDQPIKLKDILSDFTLFSLNESQYHLRFQTFLPDMPNSPIWVDILNEEAPVPFTAPGLISIKALRLPNGIHPKLKKGKHTVNNTNFNNPPSFSQPPNLLPESPPIIQSRSEKHAQKEDSDGDFVLDDDNTPPKITKKDEENKEEFKRPRIDSDTKKNIFNIIVDVEPESHEKKLPMTKTNSGNEAPAKSAKPEVKKLEPLSVRQAKATEQFKNQLKKEEEINKGREEAYALYEEKIRVFLKIQNLCIELDRPKWYEK